MDLLYHAAEHPSVVGQEETFAGWVPDVRSIREADINVCVEERVYTYAEQHL